MMKTTLIFLTSLCLRSVGLSQGVAHAEIPNSSFFRIGNDGDSSDAPSPPKPVYIRTTSSYFRLSYERGYCMPVDDKESVNDLLRNSRFVNLSFAAAWEVNPHTVYARIYRKPLLGLGFSALSFKNNQLGNPFMVYGFTEVPVTNQARRLHLSYGIGLGVSWGFNAYDKNENPLNLAIGSSVTPHLQASLNLGYWMTDKLRVSVGTGFRHFSNGSLQKPNAGINIIPVQFMAQIRTREKIHESFVPELPAFKKHMSYSAYATTGTKQMEINGPMIHKFGFGFNAGYHLSYKYRIVAGLDITHSSGSDGRVPGDASSFSKSYSYGPYLGWDWYLTERLFIPVHIGVYAHRNYENDETNILYQRLGARYLLLKDKSLSAGIALRSHFGNADFIELSVGYHF